MSGKSEGKPCDRGSELEDYREKCYNDLKKGNVRVKISESRYRCPYCPGRKDAYKHRELLEHASRVGSSHSRTWREKARHLALARFIDRYLSVKNHQPTPVTQQKHPVRDHQSTPVTLEQHPVRDHQSTPVNQQELPSACHSDPDQFFVYPWVGIVANIKTQLQGGRHVGESGSKLRDELASEGFDPQRVHPLWNRWGHSGFAVVEFKKDWDGFRNAIMFDKSFEVKSKGKKDYYGHGAKPRGAEIYGWVARDDDYNAKGLIGDYLRKMGDLKSVSALEKEDQDKASKLLMNLSDTLKTKKRLLKEIKTKFDQTSQSMNIVMQQKDDLIKSYNEEMRKTQQNARDYLETILLDHQKAALDLEAQKKQLLLREEQLEQHRAQNENERKKLQHQKKMNGMATLEQQKADENMLKLAEDHQTEKEKLHKKIIELEKQLDAKHALELEIKHLEGALQVMEHMEDEDGELKKKMDEIQQDLNEKQEDLDNLDALYQTLVVKERQSNNELQDARKELINGLREAPVRRDTQIVVKRMGDLDSKPFRTVAEKKYSNEEVDEKAMELCSEWEDYLRDPSWHPFKVIVDNQGGCKIFNSASSQHKKNKKENEAA